MAKVLADKHTFTVGFLTCASWRVNREETVEVHQQSVEQVANLTKELGTELAAAREVPTSDDQFDAILAELNQKRPDALILHYAGWTEDQTILKIFDAFDCPIMLWVTRDVFVEGISRLASHVGYMEISCTLNKAGRTFCRYFGGPDEKSGKELRSFIRAAKCLFCLRGLRFGWIGKGYGSRGITDTTFSEDVIERKLYVEFERIDLEELFAKYHKTHFKDDPAQMDKLQSLGIDVERLSRSLADNVRAVEDSLRLVLAIQEIIDKYELQALSINCFPEFKQNDIPTPCFAVSVFNQNGIPASCEGDVLSGVSMFILSTLSGYPATIMDIFSYDEPQGTMDLFHCGSAAIALAEPGTVKYLAHCKPQNHRPGVTLECAIRSGEVSFLKLDMLAEECKLFLFEGDSMASVGKLRGHEALVRTTTPVKDLIEKLIDHGVSHHMVVSVGNVTGAANYFARLAKLDLVSL